MKILHIATLITPDGAYGGPIRVALNQLRELALLGHEVELVAGTRGYGENPPKSIDGVPVTLFDVRQPIPSTGYAGLMAPGLLRYVRRRLRDVDIVHVHIARDLITMPVAAMVARSCTPLAVQPHGMIIEPRNKLGRFFDFVMTRKTLRAAKVTFALTDAESVSLNNVARSRIEIERIINGVPIAVEAPSEPSKLDVLFLARLQERKRPTLFVEMAIRLLDEGIDATFSLVGPDEGEGPAVTKLIKESDKAENIRWEGALAPDLTLARIAACTVYVLPSVGEVFPMSVLEAMSVGRAIVITSSNGLAPPLRESQAALIVDETLDELTNATRELIRDATLRQRLGVNARRAAERQYTMRSVVSQREKKYSIYVSESRGPRSA